MTTLGDVIKGMGETIVPRDRVERGARKVDQLEARERDLSERGMRLASFIDQVQPAIRNLAFPTASVMHTIDS